MVMDGVNTMSKAELVILCEKHKLDGGKTVASMRYALQKFFESTDEPDAKKLKPDPLVKLPPSDVCPHGELCPNLHSLAHRTALKHGGEYRDAPAKCRDGMGCVKLRDKEHLKRYAHEDSLDKVCKSGADCPLLHVMQHRVLYEHPGFRAQPVVCRDGASCTLIKDKGHLYKYAHDIPLPAALPSSPSSVSLVSAASLVSAGSMSAAAPPAFPPMCAPPVPAVIPLSPAVCSPVAPPPPTVTVPVAPAPPSLPPAPVLVSSPSWSTKKLEDFPLEHCTEATLTPIDKNSEEFWELEEKFLAHLQGRNEDYVEKRIKKGLKPIRFVLVGAEKVSNTVLEARFEIKKQMIMKARATEPDSKDCRERVSFHGTHPKNLKSILKTGLLRFLHPLNPCKQQVDDGYFGSNKKGVYVSRYADYTLKYSNRVCAVEPADEVKTIMFRTMPGKSLHIKKLAGGIDPTEGYDSHSSPTFLEWYLFDEAQCCPQYVLTVKAVEDTRTAADDE